MFRFCDRFNAPIGRPPTSNWLDSTDPTPCARSLAGYPFLPTFAPFD
jgi:hypothetical protein